MTKKFEIELTKDELVIVKYLLDVSEVSGDPLKDTYELGVDEPSDPYGALASVIKKFRKLTW